MRARNTTNCRTNRVAEFLVVGGGARGVPEGEEPDGEGPEGEGPDGEGPEGVEEGLLVAGLVTGTVPPGGAGVVGPGGPVGGGPVVTTGVLERTSMVGPGSFLTSYNLKNWHGLLWKAYEDQTIKHVTGT